MLIRFAFSLYFCVSFSKSDDTERIAGGTKVISNEFPYYVGIAVFYTTKKEKRMKSCGGALVRPNRVITAKHCFESDGKMTQALVYPNYDNKNRIGEKRKSVQVGLIRVPGTSSHQNDIAILELKSSINLSTVNLPTQDFPPGTEVTFCGFGSDGYSKKTKFLKKVKLQITDKSKCSVTGDIRNYKCFAIRGQDQACVGDSGGPAVVKGSTPASDILVGVISAGYSFKSDGLCVSEYNTITDVYSLRNWISKNLV